MFQLFERDAKAIRETYRCKSCRALLRDREQAIAIVREFGRGKAKSIAELVNLKDFAANRIYEPGTSGPFRRYFKQLPLYFQSDFYEHPEESTKNPLLPHQSMESLTYNDGSFDLVITSDILEHVRRPEYAFAEIARVLRGRRLPYFHRAPAGPVRPKTISRVKSTLVTLKSLFCLSVIMAMAREAVRWYTPTSGRYC